MIQNSIMTNEDYLSGGIMNILFQKFAATHQKKKIVKGHLGNWCAMPLEHNEKRLEIINLC